MNVTYTPSISNARDLWIDGDTIQVEDLPPDKGGTPTTEAELALVERIRRQKGWTGFGISQSRRYASTKRHDIIGAWPGDHHIRLDGKGFEGATMTRYYVTTAKKAAFLTYNYGLNIALRMLPSCDQYNPDDDLWLLSYRYDDEMDELIEKFSEDQGEDFAPDRFYIHPDSVGLLLGMGDKDKADLRRRGLWPESEEE